MKFYKEHKNEYWECYYLPEIIDRSNQIRETHTIYSTETEVHIDVYPQQFKNAPVVIFNHGAAGYCRIFVELALALFDRGFTVVLPDQKGQGFSGGRRGDYVIQECVENIVDVANWAKEKYKSSIYMIGGSVGGALTYYAAAKDAPVDRIVSLNLFDFGNGLDGLLISRFSSLAKINRFQKFFGFAMRNSRIIGKLRIPFNWVGAFDKLMDERDFDFQKKWEEDPVPPRFISLRSLASNLETPPEIKFKDNEIPILVINQTYDKMVDPLATKQNFERLGGEKKYLEIPFGHWSNQPAFWEMIIEASVEWFDIKKQGECYE
jgi:alpha-beta hydrolase superfamily lysophospholipase